MYGGVVNQSEVPEEAMDNLVLPVKLLCNVGK